MGEFLHLHSSLLQRSGIFFCFCFSFSVGVYFVFIVFAFSKVSCWHEFQFLLIDEFDTVNKRNSF